MWFGYRKVDARIRFARGAELKMVSLLNHTCDKQMHDTMEDDARGVFRSSDSKPCRVCNMASVASMDTCKTRACNEARGYESVTTKKALAQAFWRPWYRHGCFTYCRSFFLKDHPIHHPAIGIWSDSAQSAAVWRHVYWWWDFAWGVWQWANAVRPGPRRIMYKHLLHPWYCGSWCCICMQIIVHGRYPMISHFVVVFVYPQAIMIAIITCKVSLKTSMLTWRCAVSKSAMADSWGVLGHWFSLALCLWRPCVCHASPILSRRISCNGGKWGFLWRRRRELGDLHLTIS